MEETQIMEAAERNLNFLNENFKEIEMKYPDKFIAISGAQIVAFGSTPEFIIGEIEEKKIDRADLLIEFIPVAGSVLVL